MKKLLLSVVAIVALFATSCVKEVAQTVNQDEAIVTLAVQTPGLSTRVMTLGDGTKATDLTYAIYDTNWKWLSTEKAEFVNSLETTITLRLVKNKYYNIVFWAQNPNVNCYSFNFQESAASGATPLVTVSYDNATANDESRDAFFGQLLNLHVDGNVNETVYLKRPFAQINFGNSVTDTATADKYGYDITATTTKTKFNTVAYNTLYLASGDVENAQPLSVEFTPAALPVDKVLETNQGNYDWLSMNYILWPAEEKSLSACSMTISIEGQEDIVVDYPNAPARRNWRTNLVGDLLTEDGTITVIILPAPEGEYNETVPHN